MLRIPDIDEKHDKGNFNNTATFKGEKLEGKFVSSSAINLSRRNLSKAEISLLSKGLTFVLTPNKIDRAKLKTELEEYGRKLRLMWHFRNDEKLFPYEKFDLSLHSTQGTRLQLLKHILVV